MESIERTGAMFTRETSGVNEKRKIKMGRGGRDPCVKRKYFFASTRQRDELDMFIPAGRSARARYAFFFQRSETFVSRARVPQPHFAKYVFFCSLYKNVESKAIGRKGRVNPRIVV